MVNRSLRKYFQSKHLETISVGVDCSVVLGQIDPRTTRTNPDGYFSKLISFVYYNYTIMNMYRKKLTTKFVAVIGVFSVFKNIKCEILADKFVRTRPDYLSLGTARGLRSDWIRCAASCQRDLTGCSGFQFYPDSANKCRTRNPQTGFDFDQDVQTYLRLSAQGKMLISTHLFF